MIIDCHGHCTTAPLQLGATPHAQHEALAADLDHVGTKGTVAIGDDEIRTAWRARSCGCSASRAPT